MSKQQENLFKNLIDSRHGNVVELKKDCANEVGVSWQRVNRIYIGEQEINFTPAQLDLLLKWANKNKVDGTADVTLSDLVPKTEVIA